jgi:hypothetical protein
MKVLNESKTPWNSIAESIIPSIEKNFNYSESIKSPCASCTTSPCCTHLPLTTFNISNISELDYAIYLLNFHRIELGITQTGDWNVYYRYPCRFLDRKTFFCSIHNKPEQPHICERYNPYRCWYYKTLTKSIITDYIRLDRRRLQHLISRINFNEYGDIVESPDWQALIGEITDDSLSTLNETGDQPNGEILEEECTEYSLDSVERFSEQQVFTYEQLQNPCSDCRAYCCKTLYFFQYIPEDVNGIDYLRFCLGFPNIELGINDNNWYLILKTTCRHLEDNRCTLFGKPERPLTCKYYDEWKCLYKLQFSQPLETGFLRVRLEQFRGILDCVEFDRNGIITFMPSTEDLRSYIASNLYEEENDGDR